MAVEEINSGSTLIPGLRLGYDLLDTCWEPVVAMKPGLVFMAEAGSRSVAAYCDYMQYQPHVLAVIGPHSSEVALVTGKFFSFFLMPHVRPPARVPAPARLGSPCVRSCLGPAGQLRRQHGQAEQPQHVPVPLPHGAQRPRAGGGRGGAAAGAALDLGGRRGRRRRVQPAGPEPLLWPG